MGKPARILIVDDDESIRKTIASILEEKGYTVDTAENGRDAVTRCKAKEYNLALVDIRLPDTEGTKLLHALETVSPKMVKIIMTGYPALQNAIEAANQGADAYLIKPVKIDILLNTIEEHLEKQRKSEKYSEVTVAEFLETRIKELEKQSLHKKNH